MKQKIDRLQNKLITEDIMKKLNNQEVQRLDDYLKEIEIQITNIKEELKSKDYITATIQSETVYEANTTVPLTVILSKYGNKLSLNSGAIKIGVGVSKVELSGQVFYWKGDNRDPYQWATIKLNDKQISTALADNSGGWASVHFSTRIIDVKEGDTITLVNISKGRIRNDENTYLHVKVVE